jgi:hypothetical protein
MILNESFKSTENALIGVIPKRYNKVFFPKSKKYVVSLVISVISVVNVVSVIRITLIPSSQKL